MKFLESTLKAVVRSAQRAAHRAVTACAAGLLCAAAIAQPVRVERVEAELVAERGAVAPGGQVRIGLRLRHDAHWHTYWRNPGDSGLPTTLALQLPAGWSASAFEWPAPKWLALGPLANYGYEGEVVLPMVLRVPADAAEGTVTLRGRAAWLMCRDVCIPGEADLRLALPVRRVADASASVSAQLFEQADAGRPARRVELQAGPPSASWTFALPASFADASRAVFFPYDEQRIAHAAPQALHRDARGAWLSVTPSPDLDPKALAARPLEGVLVVDGEVVEARVRIGPAAIAPAGSVVAEARPEPVSMPGGGLLGATGAPAGGGLLGERAVLGGAVSQGAARAPDGGASVAPASAGGFLGALAFALLGGLILNAMPCVFPVIGLKVLGFAGHGDAGAAAASRRAGLAFGAGVLGSFWVLAGLLLAVQAGGEAVGWGFQLQSPPFVAALALLFVAIGLNFAGVFEVGAMLTRLGNVDPAARRSGPAAAFGSGVLAVLVATPCTAPFMGSALGYTLGRPAVEVLAVFGALGLGMAAPYVVLGWFPGWLKWLPRPGRWMQTLRQGLAFPMFATAVWLAWVLAQQAGVDALLRLGLGAVLLAFAAWLAARVARAPARALAAACAVCALWLAWPVSGGSAAAPAGSAAQSTPAAAGEAPAGWQPWSVERVESLRAAARPVFVDFTAAWCVSCQVNKRVALDSEAVQRAMAARGVARLRADWTQRDPAITAALAGFGRSGVPLYLLYLPGESMPRVLPELLTPGIVLEALAAVPPISSSAATTTSVIEGVSR